MHQAYGQIALDHLGVGRNGIIHATDSAEVSSSQGHRLWYLCLTGLDPWWIG